MHMPTQKFLNFDPSFTTSVGRCRYHPHRWSLSVANLPDAWGQAAKESFAVL